LGLGLLNERRRIAGRTALLLLPVLLLGVASSADEERQRRLPLYTSAPQSAAGLEAGRFFLELSPYYSTYKAGEEDAWALSAYFSADLGGGWEVRLASDTLTYQRPASGFSDLFVGAKWCFHKTDTVSLAVMADLEIPNGAEDFREPAPEPTLTFLTSWSVGVFQYSLTVGSTRVKEEPGGYYFTLNGSLELDLLPDENNAYSVWVSGYGPDQRVSGASRVSVGLSYSRQLDARNAVGLYAMQGLSGRGVGWCVGFTWDVSF
jgi:hypothetical protein